MPARPHRPTRPRAALLRVLAALTLAAPAPSQDEGAPPAVDGARLNARLQRLAEIGASERGCMRVAFSRADVEGRGLVREWMEAAGLEVRVDAAGNLIGRRQGGGGLPALMVGSHIDTVPMGGDYDGTVGSLAAIEVAQVLHERGIRLRHDLEVVVFSNEENGKTGSKAMAGEVEEADLRLLSHAGISIRRGLQRIGGDPERLAGARREPAEIAAFFELHIEQGAALEEEGVPIGVVQGIVGIRRWEVSFEGMANHAGTTPMHRRRDALVAAARLVDAVHRIASEMPGRQVATVGRIRAVPGAPNVVPGRAELSLEIRDLSMERIDEVYRRVVAAAAEIEKATGTTFHSEPFYVSRAAPTDERARELVRTAAARLGLATMDLPSGAGHDAQSIARLAPIGMIFVPSAGGISHSPAEFSRAEDIERGANVLLSTLLLADRRDW